MGAFPRLTGRQQPEYETWHPGDESEGDRTARFGIKVGVRLLPWEWMLVRAAQSTQPPDEWGIELWTHRNVVWEVTRQQGKTLMLALLIIRRLFKYRRRVVYTAQQWATVEDVFDRVCAIIDRIPSLRNRLAAPPSKKNNRGTLILKPMPGEKHVVKANFGPRTQHFARGFTEIDDLILDEAYDLVPKETANLTGAQAASDNPQTIYASTPPVVSEHPNCGRFAGFIHTIIAGGAPGLYGALYRAPKRFQRGDPKAYPLAQPSYGVVGNDREMEAHLQGAKDAGPIDLALFDADWLGWGSYPPPASGAQSEISAEKWETMRNPAPKLIGRPVVTLTREDTWAITAAQRTADGRIHIEVGYADAAAANEIVAKLVELRSLWDPSAVVVGRGEAAEVVPELELAGFEPIVPKRTDEAQACGGFLSDALAETSPPLLSHSGQLGLAAAAKHAHKREIAPSGFIWEVFDPASHAQLMGATLARWALLKHGAPTKRKTVAPRSGAQQTKRRTSRSFDPMTAAF
ncbi:MAG: terminase [Mycobacterium sp.]